MTTSPALERAEIDEVDNRGNGHHRGIASYLNIINDDVSINVSFSF